MPWIQYDLETGIQQATNSAQVSEEALDAVGRSQIWLENDAADPNNWHADISTTPHSLFYAPPEEDE